MALADVLTASPSAEEVIAGRELDKAHSIDKDAIVSGGLRVEELEAPDPQETTTRTELWSYYTYYIGNSGLGPFNFAPTQFQNLLALAGSNLGQPGVACDYTVPCVLPFAGMKERNISSIVLVTNGISFAIQVVLFLCLGSLADFGNWRRWILIGFTGAAIAISFGWLGVESAEKWQIGTGLYIVGLISYQGALTFWTAAFPQLARCLPEMQESQAKLISGETTAHAHNQLDSLSRNRISNISFTICSIGELVLLAIMVGILKGIHSSDSVEQNTKALSITVAFSGAAWLILALPWFLTEKSRPGQPLPAGSNYVSVGFTTVWTAFKEARKLTDTMLYLVLYFLLSDCLNTTVTVISTLQYSIVSYSTLQLTYLLIVGIFTQGLGMYVFWWIQRYWKLSTKTMFCAVAFFILCLAGWGMIGAWTNKIGFHHLWEIWLYQALYGLLVCPWYSYSQTMISEVIPEGKEFLFFALFSVCGKTSAFIGPFCTSAISARSNNVNDSFIFLFVLGALSCIILFFIDIDRSRRQCREYLIAEENKLYNAGKN